MTFVAFHYKFICHRNHPHHTHKMSQPITVLEMDRNQRKQERKKKHSELAEKGLNGAATLLGLNPKRLWRRHGSQLLASTLPFLLSAKRSLYSTNYLLSLSQTHTQTLSPHSPSSLSLSDTNTNTFSSLSFLFLSLSLSIYIYISFISS